MMTSFEQEYAVERYGDEKINSNHQHERKPA